MYPYSVCETFMVQAYSTELRVTFIGDTKISDDDSPTPRTYLHKPWSDKASVKLDFARWIMPRKYHRLSQTVNRDRSLLIIVCMFLSLCLFPLRQFDNRAVCAAAAVRYLFCLTMKLNIRNQATTIIVL